MRDPALYWLRKGRELEKSRRLFRDDPTRAVAVLSAALAQIAAAADGSKGRLLARQARRLRRRLAKLRLLCANRELLARVRRLGFLSPEAAESLEARWEEHASVLGRKARRQLRGAPMRKLRRVLARHARRAPAKLIARLEQSHRRAVERLGELGGNADDRQLRRHLRLRRDALALALALEEAGAPAPADALADRGDVALVRWRELSVFRRSLRRELREAERRGTVVLALGLDGLLAALDTTLTKARREAAASAAATNVVSFRRASA